MDTTPPQQPLDAPAASRLRRLWAEVGGACGDLGTLLPHTIGAITVAGLAPAGILTGLGAFFIASGLFYGLPMAVQPMKAVSAVLLTGQMGPGEVAATGIVIGAMLIVLAVTGMIGWLARAIPQSVSAGLQLGLGLSMASIGLGLVWRTPWLGMLSIALLVGLLWRSRLPAALVTIVVAVAIGSATGTVAMPASLVPEWSSFSLVIPTWSQLVRGLELMVVPQLPLTLTNAVIVTALVSRELFPNASGRASERNLALTSGLANLLLAPFGAMPMCHGAGGVQAQHRFGARSGLAPVLLGALLLIIGLFFAARAGELLALIPAGAVGALLLIAGADLASSRRLFDSQPSCWPVIAVAAAGTLFANPAIGLGLGIAGEMIRRPLVRMYFSERAR